MTWLICEQLTLPVELKSEMKLTLQAVTQNYAIHEVMSVLYKVYNMNTLLQGRILFSKILQEGINSNVLISRQHFNLVNDSFNH